MYDDNDLFSWVIVSLPFFYILFGLYRSWGVKYPTQAPTNDTSLEVNGITIGLVIIVPLITTISNSGSKKKKKFISILVTAIILNLFSSSSLWVDPAYVLAIVHSRSILTTLSIFLVIYALYVYYLEAPTAVIVST